MGLRSSACWLDARWGARSIYFRLRRWGHIYWSSCLRFAHPESKFRVASAILFGSRRCGCASGNYGLLSSVATFHATHSAVRVGLGCVSLGLASITHAPSTSALFDVALHSTRSAQSFEGKSAMQTLAARRQAAAHGDSSPHHDAHSTSFGCEAVEQLGPRLDAMGSSVAREVEQRVDNLLARRRVSVEGLSLVGVEQVLQSALASTGIFDAVSALREARTTTTDRAIPASSAPAPSPPELGLFHYIGRFHRVPEDFTLPQGTLLTAWQQYCLGNSGKGYPPLRFVCAQDLPNAKMRKRLFDYKKLMRLLETEARRLQIWVDEPQLQACNEIFYSCEPVLRISAVSKEDRMRRVAQLSWMTIEREALRPQPS
eukprot:m.48391 g.48391  ORF g.48391 m.48391 type:complete len:372 (-) comp47731_c0_seq1:90-1205(-)